MGHVSRVLATIENTLAAVSLALAAALGVTETILRFVFNESLVWASEAVTFLVVWSSFIGAVIALRNDEHVGMDVIKHLLRRGGERLVGVIGGLLVVLYCGAIGLIAWTLVMESAEFGIDSPTLHLPMWLVQLAVPLGLTLMLFRALERLVLGLRKARPAVAHGAGENETV